MINLILNYMYLKDQFQESNLLKKNDYFVSDKPNI